MSYTSQDALIHKILSGGRISTDEARTLFDWDLLELGQAARYRADRAVPGGRVGFIIDRIINYTNVCEAACTFCAYHARAGRIEPYTLGLDVILAKVEELLEIGGTQVMLQGGLHPELGLEELVHMVREIKAHFPGVYLHSFSPAEVVHLAKRDKLSIDEVITRLQAAGVDSMPGASDLLVERIREQVSPKKLSVQAWCEVMDSLARHHMQSSATMTYGMGETLEERIGHLEVVRSVQDRHGLLRAFIPWSFSPAGTALPAIIPATGVDYLKVVALSRIFLDNVAYIQAGWLTEGMKLAQLALDFGANDMGGVLMEEVVVKATGIRNKTNMDELMDVIQNAGKIPFQRDSQYRLIREYDKKS